MRAHHGKDESAHPHALPDAVVFAQTTDEVASVVKLCAQHRVPLIPFGAGSSVEGHVLAIHGGIALDLTRMNRVLAVNVDDLDVTVEAGVTRKQLNQHLHDTRTFFPDRSRRRRDDRAAWRQPARPAPTPCATARCAKT